MSQAISSKKKARTSSPSYVEIVRDDYDKRAPSHDDSSTLGEFLVPRKKNRTDDATLMDVLEEELITPAATRGSAKKTVQAELCLICGLVLGTECDEVVDDNGRHLFSWRCSTKTCKGPGTFVIKKERAARKCSVCEVMGLKRTSNSSKNQGKTYQRCGCGLVWIWEDDQAN